MTDAGLEALISRLPWAVALNAAMAAAAYGARTIRAGGAVAGAALGGWILAAAGWGPFALLATFFVLGSVATRWGWSRKEKRGLAEGHKGARGVRQVLANGLPAAVMAALYGLAGGDTIYALGFAGSLAAASADTASSELGQVYGARPIHLTSLKRAPVGAPGAVSAAGTVAGAGASVLIGVAGVAAGVVPLIAVPMTAAGAIIAVTCESAIASATSGAAGHHFLNAINSSVGAGCTMLLWALLV